MEDKKEIRIKFSTLLIFILVLIIIGLLCYIFMKPMKANQVANSPINNNDATIYNNVVENAVENTNNNKTTEVEEMSAKLAKSILKKYKEENLKDANWELGKVELCAHGDNDTYLVGYEEINNDGYTEYVSTIIQYKNGEWITDLPGSSGYPEDFYEEYGFVNYGEDTNNKTESSKLTKKDAEKILSEVYSKLANLYTEKQFEYSSSEMNKNHKAKITNYDSIINEIFTEDGKKIYEKEMENLITIENGKAYLHAGDDYSSDIYAGFDIENIKIKSEDSINCTIIKKLDYSVMNDEETEIVKVKSYFSVKKLNGKWLIEDFDWAKDK